MRSSLITSYSLKHCLGNKVMIFNFPKSLHDILLPEESLSTLNLLVVVVGFRCSVVSDSLWHHRVQPARLFCPWGFPGKNTGVGCHFLLHCIFLTQGSNASLLHCRQILYHLSYRGGPHWRYYFPSNHLSLQPTHLSFEDPSFNSFLCYNFGLGLFSYYKSWVALLLQRS